MNAQHGKYLRQFAAQYGVPWPVAQALIRAESGGNPNAVSPVGAIGYGQLMPGTARGLGVNPHDPIQNLKGSMKYLGHLIQSFHGNLRYAVAAYNAGPAAVTRYGGIPPYKETQDYVKRVFAMAGPGQNNRQFTTNRLNAVNTLGGVPRTGALNPRLADALALAAPTEGSQSILERLGGTAARASEAASAPIPLPASQTPGGQGLPSLPGTMTRSPQQAVGRGGKYVIAPGANRAGVKLQNDILGFLSQVSGVYGRTLKVGTGTNHSRLTVDGNESQHWTGHAVDVPATGATLIAMGRAALIAAGADPRWANRQKGGLYNIGGRQIIFNTHKGGDHTNHLHLGA